MGRVDYWSAWPGVTTPISGPFTCEINEDDMPVCEPSRTTGTFGAAVAPAWNASVAFRLAVQLGG